MNGKIVKYFSRRGFGFISPDDSQEEIFFHVSSYPTEVEPEIGKAVEFEVIETPKGKEAKNVKVLAEPAEEEDVEAESPEEEEAPEEDVEAESPEEEEAPVDESLGVGDIKGVGKATEEKLVAAGFDTVASIAAVDGDALSEKAGISAKVAAKIVAAAKELLE